MTPTMPRLVSGGLAVDDRGQLAFVNDFALSEYKRFYLVTNHRSDFVRAWHGHKNERKAVTVISGAAIVAAVAIDDWDSPSPDLEMHRYTLSSKKPAILEIPAGYANGFMTLQPDTTLCFFSSSTLEESANDDYRFAARLWDPWQVEER